MVSKIHQRQKPNLWAEYCGEAMYNYKHIFHTTLFTDINDCENWYGFARILNEALKAIYREENPFSLPYYFRLISFSYTNIQIHAKSYHEFPLKKKNFSVCTT